MFSIRNECLFYTEIAESKKEILSHHLFVEVLSVSESEDIFTGYFEDDINFMVPSSRTESERQKRNN